MAHPIAYKNFTETDFEEIKNSLKTYLRNQDTLKDFDFEGAAINVLLNLLAYNTQYNAYYLNMMASEKFISHAQKRESVVGLANNIGYVPRSRKSSTAIVSFTVTPDGGFTDPITLPKDLTFTSTIDGITYDFLTTTTHVATISGDGKYYFTDIELKQGRKFTHKYLVDQNTKFYTLPNIGIDTDRLTVTLKSSPLASSGDVFTKFDNFTQLTDTSQVFFVQETYNQLYEIYFGDGVVGIAPQPGNQIVVDYYVCSGDESNGARTFVLDDEVSGIDSIEFTEITAAYGGADIEGIESVRLSAPSNYVTQNRAVVAADYETIIKRIAPDVAFVNVWGGEDANPPQYGKVFISVMGEGGVIVTQTVKDQIKNELRQFYTIMSIFPEIIDPKRLYIELGLTVKYNSNTMHTTVSQIQSAVMSYIGTYTNTELSKFGATFRESKFISGIDDSSSDIISSNINTRLYYNISDFITTSTISFNQAIATGSIDSTEFTYNGFTNCKFDDNVGSLSIVRFNNQTNSNDVIHSSVGTVDYTTGTIVYTEPNTSFFSIYTATNNEIKIYAKTSDVDIEGVNNTVLLINNQDVTVDMVNDV